MKEENGREAWMQVGRWLAIAALVAALALFWNSPLLWPVKIFVVFLHELSHTIALIVTGGHPSGIQLSPREGGVAWGTGGNRFVVLNAGYLGSLLWGLVLLAVANKRAAVPWFLRGMGVALGIATVIWMRPLLSFGFLFGSVVAVLLFVLGKKLSGAAGSMVLRFLGIFSCLYALIDIQLDVLHPASWGRQSDASMLAELTGIPAIVWGIGWSLLSIGVLIVFRKTIVGRPGPPSRS